MKTFKFLTKNKLTFAYEMTEHIRWVPATLMGFEHWTTDRSTLIKAWLEDYFDGVDTHRVKYFPEFDRMCRIIQTGIDTFWHQRYYTARIWIMRNDYEYMEIDLKYPII